MPYASEKKPKKTYIYFIIIIAVASLATLFSTLIIYRNSVRAAEESLKLQALGIAASLEPSLQAIHVKEGIFEEIVTDSSWEGIAFIALYDKSGLTLLHSNKNLVGRRIDSPDIKRSAGEDKPVFGYATLGTGEEIFILNYPIHTPDSVKVLRLALHPYPAQNITRQARFQAISILVTVVILWAMGFFFIKAVRRSDKLTAMMAERERLAVIGEMAAVLAHEIRNPLGSIKGFAQYLSEKSSDGKGELNVIVEEARRLERLTEDLLLFAKPSEVRTEEFNLHELVNESVRALQESERLKQTAITVNAEIPVDMMIVSDREKLKQILSNALQNAADAVNERGLIELKAEQTGDKIIIIVSDNGCGMDEGTRSMAFNSFFTTKAKGTGLGLAIVAKLAKALGGHAELKSKPANGTAFRIELPAALNKGRYE
jgi:two-component system, NtrC family, sensor histidine kinase HydH